MAMHPPPNDRLTGGETKRSKGGKYLALALASLAATAAAIGNFEKIRVFFFPEPPQILFEYKTLQGHAVSLFLRGSLPDELKDQIGQKYFIIRNDVWDYGNKLYRKHQYSITDDSNLDVTFSTAPADLNHDQMKASLLSAPLMEGVSWDYRTFSSDFDYSEAWDGKWSLDVVLYDSESRDRFIKEGVVDLSNLQFSRTMNCKEFLKAAETNDWPYRKLYAELTSEYCPSDFAYTFVSYSGCAGDWDSQTSPPSLSLNIIAFQNVSKDPVTLGSLVSRVDRSTRLRLHGDNSRGDLYERQLNNIMLLPGQTAYLGSRLFLAPGMTDETEVDFGLDEDTAVLNTNEILAVVARHKSIRIVDETMGSDGEERVEAQVFRSAIRSSQMPGQNSYTVGPAESLIAVRGPRFEVEARPAPERFATITEEMQGGSCPRLFATYAAGGQANYEGKFLMGWNRQGLDGTDYVKLSGWPLNLQVMERDRETTYLRTVDIVCSDSGAPDKELSIDLRDQPLVLGRGESVSLPVPEQPAAWNCGAVFAKFRGHYVLDSD